MSQKISWLIGLLVIVLLIVGGIGVFQVYFLNSTTPAQKVTDTWPKDVVAAQRSGDYKQAVENSLAIQNDPSKTADAKATAMYNSLGAAYRATGDKTAIFQDIQNMKKVILDPAVSLQVRVDTLDVLAKEYDVSGNDPAVFAEMYKDAPFSTYLAPGDPILSARHLAEWSYSMQPSSNAAVIIARWYSDQLINDSTLSAATTKEYVATTEDYLKKADTASATEQRTSPSYTDSRRFLFYRAWRALIIGRLAGFADEYKSKYRSEFDSFIEIALKNQNAFAKEILLPTRLAYAQRLAADEKDTTNAKKQLDQLAVELNTVSDPDTDVFFRFLRNEHTYHPTGNSWRQVQKMVTISPDFKAAIEKIIGTKM